MSKYEAVGIVLLAIQTLLAIVDFIDRHSR